MGGEGSRVEGSVISVLDLLCDCGRRVPVVGSEWFLCTPHRHCGDGTLSRSGTTGLAARSGREARPTSQPRIHSTVHLTCRKSCTQLSHGSIALFTTISIIELGAIHS